MQIVIFEIQKKWYGIPSDEVEEITEPVNWTEVPQSPDWVLGLINLRGNVYTLINFDNFLNNRKGTDELCYNSTVIVKREKGKVAFATGPVRRVVEVEEAALQMREEQEGKVISGFLPVAGTLVNMIDLQTLFLNK